MAKTKAPAEPQSDSTAEGTESIQETPDKASLGDPRVGMPNAPYGLVGFSSRDACAKITILMQNAIVQSRQHPDAWEAARNAIDLISTRNLHPLVASYKAEAMDWLRGKVQT